MNLRSISPLVTGVLSRLNLAFGITGWLVLNLLFSLTSEAKAQSLPLLTVVSRPLAALSGPSGAVIFIQRTGPTNNAVDVYYTLDGSAINGIDYTKLPGVATIPANATFVPILIEPISRSGIITNLTVVLTVQTQSTYQFVAPGQATALIRYQQPTAHATPSVALTLTYPESQNRSQLMLTATGTEIGGWIETMEFYDGANLLATFSHSGPNPTAKDIFKFNWQDIRPGNYYLSAKATDNWGITATSTIYRVSIPDIPTLLITSPTNGARIVQSPDLEIDATAIDPDGFIYQVTFYDKTPTNVIGVSTLATLVAPPHGTTAHHAIQWQNAPLGLHQIFAEARFASGQTKRSEPVSFTIITNALQVTITSPANNASYPSTAKIIITATADTHGVPAQSVEFFAGTNSLGVATNNPIYSFPQPYQITWTNAPAGKFVITAVATDYRGFSVTSEPVNITVQPPTYSIVNVVATDPYASTTVTNIGGGTFLDTGMFTFSRTGNTNIPITIQFFLRGSASEGLDYSQVPFSLTLPAKALSTNIVITPTYRNGLIRDSYVLLTLYPSTNYKLGTQTNALVFIQNDMRSSNAPPLVQVPSPVKGQIFTDAYRISINTYASDRDGWVQQLVFLAGTNRLGVWTNHLTDSGEIGSLTQYWTNPPFGQYNLAVIATDNRGATATSAPVNITVTTRTNYLGITSPANKAFVTANSNLTITAVAVDPLGYVTLVEFYDGDTKLGQSSIVAQVVPRAGTPASHSFTWVNVPFGLHTLTARAIYHGATNMVSAPVQIQALAPASGSFVSRQLPLNYQPLVPFTVHLIANPPGTTKAYLVEDQPPAGWAVSSISDSGIYDAINNQIKFGPFFDTQARDLTYQLTPPANAQGTQTLVGDYSADGVNTAISGQTQISDVVVPAHPADNNPVDFVMTGDELTAYANAWRQGKTWPNGPNPIPTSYVTSAGALWQGGEYYTYIPGNPPPLCWVNQNIMKPKPSLAKSAFQISPASAQSELPVRFIPGNPFSVTIRFRPEKGAHACALEDQPPAGWAVAKISNDGVFDPNSGKVKWGPFFDSTERTLTYEVTPPAAANSLYTFAGLASVDGADVAIASQRRTMANTTERIPTLKSITALANGATQISFSGALGQTYVLEISTNLVDWTSIGTLTGSGTEKQYLDSTGASPRFYRAVPVQ